MSDFRNCKNCKYEHMKDLCYTGPCRDCNKNPNYESKWKFKGVERNEG